MWYNLLHELEITDFEVPQKTGETGEAEETGEVGEIGEETVKQQ
jgi:hypothetical protein